MNTLWRTVTDIFEKEEPAIWNECLPRRIVPPTGYINPRFYTATLYSHAALFGRDAKNPNRQEHTSSVLSVAACRLLAHGVPTYFIAEDFAEAVAHTKLPAGFVTASIRWPLEAMLFVLPERFSRQHFGQYVTFISAVHALPGVYPKCALNPRQTSLLVRAPLVELYVVNPKTIISSVVAPTGDGVDPADLANIPVDYAVDFPDTFEVAKLKDMPFEDVTKLEDPKAFTNVDAELSNAIAVFTLKLLLVLSARSNLIKPASVCRPAKVKRGVTVRSELWNPAIIGGDYRVSRSATGATPAGTHAAPRMHWRWGHFTHQFIGKRGSSDFVASEQLPRKEDGSINWDIVTVEQRDAFWKYHKLHYIDPVLVNAPKAAEPV